MNLNSNLCVDEQLLLFKYNQPSNRILCPECGVIVLYFDDYCHGCGFKLDNLRDAVVLSESEVEHDDSLAMKYACACLLSVLVIDPLLIDFNKRIFNIFSGLELFDVVNYLIMNDYVDILYGKDKIVACLETVDDEALVRILNTKDLPIVDSKDEKIKLIVNNVDENILESLFDDYYKVSKKGFDFLAVNEQCLVYSTIFYDFDLDYFNKSYESSNKDEFFYVDLITKSVESSISSFKWLSYSKLLLKYALIYDKYENYDLMLQYLFEYFICEVNPFADNDIKRSVTISSELKNMLVYAVAKNYLSYNKMKEILDVAFFNVKIPYSFIDKENILLLVEEAFDRNTTVNELNDHLISIYKSDSINLDNSSFYDIQKQKDVINRLKVLFN